MFRNRSRSSNEDDERGRKGKNVSTSVTLPNDRWNTITEAKTDLLRFLQVVNMDRAGNVSREKAKERIQDLTLSLSPPAPPPPAFEAPCPCPVN